MSMSRLEQLRNKFKKEEEEKKKKGSGFKESYYPFWHADFGKNITVRFLVDKNVNNPNLYYVEKREHTLSINGEDKKFPCLTMYGKECPICKLASQYYTASKKFPANSPEFEENAKKGKYYYRDRRYIMQALMRTDPLPPDNDGNSAVGKVKILQISNEFFQVIDSQIKRMIMEDEIDPFSEKDGFDFFIEKTRKVAPNGKELASYASSGFARKSTPLNLGDAEQLDLQTFIPNEPSLDVLENALEAHLGNLALSDESESTQENRSNDSDDVSARLKKLRESQNDSTKESSDTKRETTTEAKQISNVSKETSEENSTDEASEDDADVDVSQLLARIKAKRG